MRQNLVETLIGAVVLVVAAAFLAFAYGKSGVGHVSGYALTAKFPRVDGISSGTPVKIAGIKIGSVLDERLDPQDYRAIVTISVDPAVKVPEDSSLKVASEGLLGAKYLTIDPGGSDVMLKPGGEVRMTQGSVDLMDLIGQAIFSYSSGGKKENEKPAEGKSQ